MSLSIDNILFVLSKSTGLIALKSFINFSTNKRLTALILDDQNDPRSCFDELVKICDSNKIVYYIAKSKGCLETTIRNIKPSLVFVCGWYWIIEDELLNSIPGGVLGIHNSLLPQYRGHAPLVWSMINGDKVVGSSLFKIEKGMDTGRVYYQWKVEVSARYLTNVLSDLDSLISKEFGRILLNVINGNIIGVEQNHNKATYTSKRRAEDGYLNWQDSAENIIHMIKALSTPYPNAFAFIGHKKVSFINAELFPYPVYGQAGQVAFYTENFAIICCGNNEAIKVIKAIGEDGDENINSLFRRLSSPSKTFIKSNNDIYLS